MPWKRHILVVANITATSPELVRGLSERWDPGSTSLTLVVPPVPFDDGRIVAKQQLERALTMLREPGFDADGRLGDCDPMVAVIEAWDPKEFDEIVLSTLPAKLSKWLGAGLPRRIEQHTGAAVTHLVAQPPKPPPHAVHLEEPDSLGVMAPLSVLRWGARP